MNSFDSSKAARITQIRDSQNKLKRRLFVELAVFVLMAEDENDTKGTVLRLPQIEMAPQLEHDVSGGKLVLSIGSNACPVLRFTESNGQLFIEGGITKGGAPCSFKFPLDYVICVRDPDSGEIAAFEHLTNVRFSQDYQEAHANFEQSTTNTKKKPHLTVVK